MTRLWKGQWQGGYARPTLELNPHVPFSDENNTHDCDVCKQEFGPGQIAVSVEGTKDNYEEEPIYASWDICPACLEDALRKTREKT
jgi:hypothetical protein